ncbi:hypothetical protein PWY87_21875 [Kribbella solani]|uniref:hypothetical protein n=1 Tax=Kribbella solani TaxID=236067 RepID=UPI0029AE365B|nr:hypothetical protein [Kribbella solani]MDX2973343.1 hypothetical protein [Kribbella solani]MDX3004352.1 hypothetical protein [Kribbella solani]
MTKPLPALGLVIGLIMTYAGMAGGSLATSKLMIRVQIFRNDFGHTLPWLALLVAIAVVLGVLMVLPAIGSGVTTGAGLLMTVVGLAAVLLPVEHALDLIRLFDIFGKRLGASYLLFDGTVLLVGIPLLLVGIRRWTQDTKLAKLTQGPQQPQQWGGYPGQQQQPPQHRSPQDQRPQHQYPQQQPPQYPGQQPPQYPGQQPPR